MRLVIVDPVKQGITAEDAAMLMALYSRSDKSVLDNLEKVKRVGSGRFMNTYYVGYGHKSIGDCGDTDLYFEDISILAAKVIEDTPLFRGQETSSRYLDFAHRPVVDPLDMPGHQTRWLEFYSQGTEALPQHLRQLHPFDPDTRKAGETEEEHYNRYERSIKARTFDIMRGWLPAGVTTQVGWSTDLRQASDRLGWMMSHPLPEVYEMASRMWAQLDQEYPNSFQTDYDIQKYRKAIQEQHAYWDPNWDDHVGFHFSTTIDTNLEFRAGRPRGGELPWWVTEVGTCRFEFLQDYGSHRDLQRHRPGVCRVPLLTCKHGFHPWYLQSLPPHLQRGAQQLLLSQRSELEKASGDPRLKQYYIAMGYRVPTRLTYGLPATVYLVEQRSGTMIHPTLRENVHRMAHAVQDMWPGLKLHVDYNPNDWDIRRGGQTIVEKDGASA